MTLFFFNYFNFTKVSQVYTIPAGADQLVVTIPTLLLPERGEAMRTK